MGAGTDLTFNIFAHDRDAKRTLRELGNEAERTAAKLEMLNRISGGAARTSGITAMLGAVPPLASAAAGALLAIPAALATAGAAAGVLALALAGTGKAFDGIQSEFADLKGSAVGAGDAIQAKLAAPLNGDLTRVRNLLHDLTPDMANLGGAIGRAGHELATWATSAKTADQLHHIFRDSTVQVGHLGAALKNTAGLFTDLAVAGGPTMTAFTRGLANVTGGLREFFAVQAGNGRLDTVFGTLRISATGLLAALKPLAESLFNLFSSSGTQAAARTLFETLGAGTKIISTLVNAFASLPAGVQSAMVALGAAGYVASKLSGLVGGLGEWFTKAAKGALSLGEAGAGAASRLSGIGGLIGKAAGPIGLAVGAVLLLATAFGQVKPPPIERDLSKLNESFKIFNETSRMSGELLNITGGSWDRFASRVRTTGDAYDSFATRVLPAGGLELAKYNKELDAADRGHRQMDEDLKKVGQALVDTYRSGDVAGAARDFTNLTDALQSHGYSIEWINGRFKDYIDASGGMTLSQYQAASAAANTALATNLLSGSMSDAINKVGSLKNAFDILNNTFLSAEASEVGAEQAVRAFAEAIKESSGSLDKHTEAGGRAVLTLIDLSNKAAQATSDAYNQALATGTVEQATAAATETFKRHREELIQAAMAAGYSRAQAEALADQYLKMPKDVTTHIHDNAAEVSQRVMQDARDLESLNGKTANTYIYRNYVETYTYQTLGTKHDYARGGITPVHAAGGLLSKAAVFSGGRPLYAFAEPSTMQEAFIPRRGGDAGEKRRITETAAAWQGGRVDWGGGGKATAAPATPTIVFSPTINVTATRDTDGRQVGRDIADAIGAHVKSNPAWMADMMRRGGWRGN